MPLRNILVTLAALGALCAGPVAAETARAELENADGHVIGSVSAEDTSSGWLLMSIEVNEIPAGPHGIHIHETGDCSAADFSSAGGHLAKNASHGVKSTGGPHPGDLPNLVANEGGAAKVEHFVAGLKVADLMDADGAAFVIHSGADDYASQPSGEAGDRIACGEFTAD